MTERPILFSAPMIRALLDGSKTQTRRVVKGWPLEWLAPGMFTPEYVADPMNSACPYGQPGDRLWVRETFYCDDFTYPNGLGVTALWREVDGQRIAVPVEEQRKGMLDDMYYRADGEPEWEAADGKTPWRPSIHMPRWASRIDLEITGVRVERLKSISHADAAAEGMAWDDAVYRESCRSTGTRPTSAGATSSTATLTDDDAALAVKRQEVVRPR